MANAAGSAEEAALPNLHKKIVTGINWGLLYYFFNLWVLLYQAFRSETDISQLRNS